MLTDEQINVLSEALMPYFDELEQWVIQDVAKRLNMTKTYSGTIENELAAMKKLGFSPAKIRREAMKLLRYNTKLKKVIAQNTADYRSDYAEKMEQINREAVKAGCNMVYKAVDISDMQDRKIWEEAGYIIRKGERLSQISEAFSSRLKDELVNLTGTAGFKRGYSYIDARNAYTDCLNNAIIRMASGVTTIEQEIVNTIHDMADSGMRSVNFGGNSSRTMESAVRTTLRTSYGQLSACIMDSNIKQSGETLVYVSEHWGARNTGTGIENHEEWQGKVYKLDDEEHKEEEKRIGYEIKSLDEATGYDANTSTVLDPKGLHGYNCRHSHYVWFEGVSVKPEYKPEPAPKEIDGKVYDYYAMTQKMRRMERKIRSMRKEYIALKELKMDEEGRKELGKKIETKIDEYVDFCDKCDIRPKYERCRVEKAGTDIEKTQAYKDYQKMIEDAEDANSDNRTPIERIWERRESVKNEGTDEKLRLLGDIDPEKIEEAVEYYGNLIRNQDKELVFVFDKNGKVYYNQGVANSVQLGEFDLNDCIVLHNHPAINGITSFGRDDFDIIKKYQNASYRLVNEEYDYKLEIIKSINELSYNRIYIGGLQECYETGDDIQHCVMNYLKNEGYAEYDRKRIRR